MCPKAPPCLELERHGPAALPPPLLRLLCFRCMRWYLEAAGWTFSPPLPFIKPQSLMLMMSVQRIKTDPRPPDRISSQSHCVCQPYEIVAPTLCLFSAAARECAALFLFVLAQELGSWPECLKVSPLHASKLLLQDLPHSDAMPTHEHRALHHHPSSAVYMSGTYGVLYPVERTAPTVLGSPRCRYKHCPLSTANLHSFVGPPSHVTCTQPPLDLPSPDWFCKCP